MSFLRSQRGQAKLGVKHALAGVAVLSFFWGLFWSGADTTTDNAAEPQSGQRRPAVSATPWVVFYEAEGAGAGSDSDSAGVGSLERVHRAWARRQRGGS